MPRYAALIIVSTLSAGCIGLIGDKDGGADEEDGGTSSGGPAPVAQTVATRRLTKTQIANSVADVLGVDAASLASLAEVALAPELYGEFTTQAARREGFADGAIDALFDRAFAVVEPIFADGVRRDALVGCAPGSATDPCVEDYLRRVGRLLFRRPLAADEVTRYAGVVATVADELDSEIYRGLAFATAAMMQSPSFLYAPELGEPVPGEAGAVRYTSLEMASRLALALTNAGPDEELLDAGEAGELLAPEAIESHARRLLASPAGRRGLIQGFFRELYSLDNLEGLGKDPGFGAWSAGVGLDMRAEAELVLADHVFERAAPYADLLVRRDTFVTGALADVYGIDGIEGDELQAYTIPSNWERLGLLGLGAFLAKHANTNEPSPTLRGRFIRTKLLCQPIPPPPVDVDTSLPPPTGDQQTKRQRLEQHMSDPTCAGCHALMDPLGFGLDHFDAIGAYRVDENGFAIDATGDLDGVEFDGAPSLAQALADHPGLRPCLAKQVFRYATGREETVVERDMLEAIGADHADVLEIAVHVVKSDAFSHLPVEQGAAQ